MKLARRLTLALLLGIALVMAVSASLQVARERELFASDTAADELEIARAVRAAVGFVASSDGVERAEALVRVVDAAERRTRLRWIALDETRPEAAPQLDDGAVAALRAGREVSVVDEVGDDRRRFTFLPVLRTDGAPTPFAIEVSESLAPQAAYIRGSQVHIVVKTLLMLAVCGVVVSFVGMWLVGRPIQVLSEKTRRIGAGDLSGPIELRQDDEIGALARDINAMCDRLAPALRTTVQGRNIALLFLADPGLSNQLVDRRHYRTPDLTRCNMHFPIEPIGPQGKTAYDNFRSDRRQSTCMPARASYEETQPDTRPANGKGSLTASLQPYMAPPDGLEPPTRWLTASCSTD